MFVLPTARNYIRLAATTACRRASLLRPVVVPANAVFAKRHITTVKSSDSQEQSILVAQRINRPLSPHLAIYQKQLTAVLSGLHRITGVALAGGFYAITVAFAAGSILGHPIDPATLVDLASGLPAFVDYSLKAIVAFPFVFHSVNGIRHLIWDAGSQLTIKDVYTTGYVALALTAVLGVWLIVY
ncbi:DEKNAAC105168 [Brettanomyces naardenensis]|uniref:DEKNAAC105168 n=1 Tax=Brettanomyces naardenensis TaxID=13370 RepID=A0A448YT26_BRENA|nr:DEKNAAC105168 [Brettanomyces naardenensis]